MGITKRFLYFYLILTIVKLSINNINEEYINDINNNKLDNIKSNHYTFIYNDVALIENINNFPLKLFSKLPFKDESNFVDLLFNFYLKDKNNNEDKNINLFNNIIIKASIITNSIYEQIINSTENDEDIFKNISNINSKLDLSTKSAVLKINKTLSIKENKEEDLYLYVLISNNNHNTNINNYNLWGEVFLTTTNYKNHYIPKNIYINNKIYYDGKNKENNYYLYHLHSEGEDTFLVDFSSNYALNRGIYISFLDYDKNKNIGYDEISENSTNIEFISSPTHKGKTYHFEFKLKNNNKDVVFCVITKRKPDELESYNYIFKFNTYNSGNKNIKTYELNNKVKFSDNVDKTKLELENIKIKNNLNDKIEYLKGEIYIRKILNNDKIKREDLDTIGIIESKYELVNGKINYISDNKNIEIEIPKIDENDYYSIFINLPIENEKFVYNTINTPNIKRPIWEIIAIFISIPLYLGIVIAIIIFYLKYKDSNLKEKIMKTSFAENEAGEGLIEGKDEGNDKDNVLE